MNNVAEIIIAQLAGNLNKINLFIGLKQAMKTENGVVIKFKAKAKNKANYVRIDLTPADDYTVTFGRVWGTKVTEVSKHEMIYCDMLKELFERETGLYLSF